MLWVVPLFCPVHVRHAAGCGSQTASPNCNMPQLQSGVIYSLARSNALHTCLASHSIDKVMLPSRQRVVKRHYNYRGPDQQEEEEEEVPKYSPPVYPVVKVHKTGLDLLRDGWMNKVGRALNPNCHDLLLVCDS